MAIFEEGICARAIEALPVSLWRSEALVRQPVWSRLLERRHQCLVMAPRGINGTLASFLPVYVCDGPGSRTRCTLAGNRARPTSPHDVIVLPSLRKRGTTLVRGGQRKVALARQGNRH